MKAYNITYRRVIEKTYTVLAENQAQAENEAEELMQAEIEPQDFTDTKWVKIKK